MIQFDGLIHKVKPWNVLRANSVSSTTMSDEPVFGSEQILQEFYLESREGQKNILCFSEIILFGVCVYIHRETEIKSLSNIFNTCC